MKFILKKNGLIEAKFYIYCIITKNLFSIDKYT